MNEAKMDQILLELGFADVLMGTDYLREAVRLYAAGKTLVSKEVYPAVAVKFTTQPARAERAMRHSIERAWERGSLDAQQRYFGWSISAAKGRPTVGEFIARLARVCREN